MANYDLVVRLLGETKSFDSAMKGAQNVLRSVGTTIAGLAGAASIAVFTKNTLDTMDAVGKLADRLNTTTQALGGLRYAGDLAGVGTAGMEQALDKLNVQLGEAQKSDEVAKSFARLGVSAAELKGMDTAEAFLRIADGVSKMSDSTARAEAVTQIFGKTSVGLINTLAQGSEAMRLQMAEADRLGITFSRSQAASAEAINDAMTKIKAAVTGLFAKSLEAALPWIQRTAALVTNLVDRFGHWVPVLFGVAAGLTAVGVAMKVATAIATAWAAAQKAAAIATAFVQSMTGPKGWLAIAGGLAVAAGATYAIDRAMRSTESSATAAAAAVSRVQPGGGAATGTGAPAVVPSTDSTAALREYYDTWASKLSTIADLVRKPLTPMQQMLAYTEDLNQLYARGMITLEQRNQLLHAINQKMLIQPALEKAAEMRRNMAQRAGQIRESVMTPVERLRGQLAEFGRLARAGFLDPTTLARAVRGAIEQAKVVDTVAGGQRAAEAVQFSGAALAGTSEAWSSIMANVGRKEGKRKTEGEKEIVTNLKQIRDAVRSSGVEKVIDLGGLVI